MGIPKKFLYLFLSILFLVPLTSFAKELIVPYMTVDSFGSGQWISFVKVVNLSSSPATLTGYYYEDDTGNTGSVDLGEIPAHGGKVIYGYEIAQAASLTRPFTLKIVSNQNIAATAIMKTETGGQRTILVYDPDEDPLNGLFIKGIKEIIPYIFTGTHDFHRIANLSDSPISVDVKVYDDSGTARNAGSFSVPAHNRAFLFQGDYDVSVNPNFHSVYRMLQDAGYAVPDVGSEELIIYTNNASSVATCDIMRYEGNPRTIQTKRIPILDDFYYADPSAYLAFAVAGAIEPGDWVDQSLFIMVLGACWGGQISQQVDCSEEGTYTYTVLTDNLTATCQANSGFAMLINFDNCKDGNLFPQGETINGTVKLIFANDTFMYEVPSLLTITSYDGEFEFELGANSTGYFQYQDNTVLVKGLNVIETVKYYKDGASTPTNWISYALAGFSGKVDPVGPYSFANVTLVGEAEITGMSSSGFSRSTPERDIYYVPPGMSFEVPWWSHYGFPFNPEDLFNIPGTRIWHIMLDNMTVADFEGSNVATHYSEIRINGGMNIYEMGNLLRAEFTSDDSNANIDWYFRDMKLNSMTFDR